MTLYEKNRKNVLFDYRHQRALIQYCKLKRKAILFVETALVLPIFIMAMISLLTIIDVFFLDTKVEAALCEEAKIIAMESYDGNAYGVSGIEANVLDRLNNSNINTRIIKNNEFDFSKTDLTDKELMYISARYAIVPPFDMFSLFEINREKVIVAHRWCGYINGLNSNSMLFEYVYMTKNGKVYHRSRECSHIRLHINVVDGSNIKNVRNEMGEKYKKCTYCKPKLTDSKLYVTTDGNKYHNTLSCSGLKRTVIRVRLSQLKNVEPCSRCGY